MISRESPRGLTPTWIIGMPLLNLSWLAFSFLQKAKKLSILPHRLETSCLIYSTDFPESSMEWRKYASSLKVEKSAFVRTQERFISGRLERRLGHRSGYHHVPLCTVLQELPTNTERGCLAYIQTVDYRVTLCFLSLS